MTHLRSCAPILLLGLLLAGCSTVGRPVEGIANFDTVNPPPQAIYRGGQPSEAGIDTLRAMGVRTVIDLRDDAEPWEKQKVESAGMTYLRIPTSAAKVEPQKIERTLAALRTSPRPIYIHCREGRDRTGLQVAIYRILDQSWSRQQAIAELHAHGYNWLVFPGIERYLKTFTPATQ